MKNRKSMFIDVNIDIVVSGDTTPFMLKAIMSSFRPVVCCMFFRISPMCIEGYVVCTKHSLVRRETICNYRENKLLSITFVVVGACPFCMGEKTGGFVAIDAELGEERFLSNEGYESRRSM